MTSQTIYRWLETVRSANMRILSRGERPAGSGQVTLGGCVPEMERLERELLEAYLEALQREAVGPV